MAARSEVWVCGQ